MAPPWLQSVNGWAFLSENDDQLIFCRAAITHDRYLSLSQPIKHRKFIKILSCEVIANDRIFHLNVQECNTVFCGRDPRGECRQEGYRLGQSMNLCPWQSSWWEWTPTSHIKEIHGPLFLEKGNQHNYRKTAKTTAVRSYGEKGKKLANGM